MSSVLKIENPTESLAPVDLLENFKSLYYLLKGKRDTDIKLFNGNKLIRKSDLVEINRLMQEKFRLHHVNSGVMNISVTLNNNEVKTFGIWESFESYNWYQAAHTETIVLEWEFNIVNPNQQVKVPQTHTLRLRIGGALRPNEFFHVVMTGAEDFEIGQEMSEVVCKIDFVNTTLCSELRSLVTDWYDALTKNTRPNFWVRYTRRHRGKIGLLLVVSALFTCTILLNLSIRAVLAFLKLDTLAEFFKWFFFAVSLPVPIYYGVWKMMDFYSDKIIDSTVGNYLKIPMIELTKGDTNRINEVKSSNNKLLKELGYKVAVTILANILFVIVGQWLPQLLEWIITFYTKK